MHHTPRGLNESWLANMMARFFPLHHTANKAHQLTIAGAALHHAVEIVVEERKQARADLSVRGDADARAVSAKGMRNRSDDANFSNSIFEGVASRRLASCMLRKRLERLEFGELRHNLIECDHNLGVPNTIFFERHKLDEADDHTLIAGEPAEFDDLIFVEAAQQHAVHLHGI